MNAKDTKETLLALSGWAWLRAHRDEINVRISNGDYGNGFEFPDYYGMPQEISYMLSSAAVDEIQGELNGPNNEGFVDPWTVAQHELA